MIKYKIDQVQLNKLIKSLEKIGKVIGSKNLQLYRAKKFREFTVKGVERNNIGLKKLSNATIRFTGDHSPLWLTGKLIKHMGVRPAKGNAADAGFFENDKTLYPNTNITITKLVCLHHTGYRIRVNTPKGQAYMRFLASQGFFDGNPEGANKGRGFIEVPPRPFMLKSINLYESKGLDMKATDRFLDRLMKAPGEKSV